MCESRTPPVAVARQLRQESGFGCVICGCPIIEYHHIIEWSERKHFEPEHMVVLCPTHHRELGKLNRNRAYTAKANPINIRHGQFRGLLGGTPSLNGVRFGRMEFIDCATAVQYSGLKMISTKAVDGETMLDLYFPKADFWPEIEVKNNAVSTLIDSYWDIEFKTNWVKFKRFDRSFIEVDFRHDLVEIHGEFKLHGNQYTIGKNTSNLDGINLLGSMRMEGLAVGLDIGNGMRVLRPNYAMAAPAPVFLGY